MNGMKNKYILKIFVLRKIEFKTKLKYPKKKYLLTKR